MLVLSSSLASALGAHASLADSYPIASNGLVTYSGHRRVGLWGISSWSECALDPQAVVDKLNLKWSFASFTWEGGGLGNLYSLINANVTHIIPCVSQLNYYDHEEVMLILANNVDPSLDHPEIYGVYWDEYIAQINRGRTRAQVEEIQDYIRTTNPNLKVVLPWGYWYEDEPNKEEYLSWLDGDYDEISLNFFIIEDEWHQVPVTELEMWIDRTRERFPGKPIWVTIYSRTCGDQQGKRDLTEQEFKYQCEVLRNAYDAGAIKGALLYVGEYLHWTDAMMYVDWFAEEFAFI